MVADGLVAWLIALVGDAGRRKLTELVVGSEVERALAGVSDAAIARTAAEFASATGGDAGGIARVIGERFALPGPDGVSAEAGTLLEAIRSGVAAQIAVLGDRSVTGSGVSSADVLGVGWEEITEALSAHLIGEMLRAAAGGGPLAALASQLNHDVTHLQNERAAGKLDSLSAGLAGVLDAIGELRDALASVQRPERVPGSGALWFPAIPPVRKIEVARARRAAEALAPPALIGRTSELAALAELAGSARQWIWVQGDAFAGKTALLAWFALHPPDGVDVVACFLRRTTGDNSADYALDVLARQVALIAGRHGYVPPPFLPERANDFLDLLGEAAWICAASGRKLLVLIDGLDEYDPAPSSLDLAAWLPDARTLPGAAILAVSSRAGVDPGISPAHPLGSHALVITASDSATEVRDAARSELKQALTAPGGFIFPLVCCLAVAESGLTASELASLLCRRGRDADVSEIEAVLGSALGRSLMRTPDPDGLGTLVHVFAHESLLAEARALLAADLAAYEDLLDSWADDYARRNWPVDTPRYLLRPYTRELDRRARDPAASGPRCRAAVDQLFLVVTRDARSRRLFERTGSPAVPFREVVAAQHAISETRDRSGLDADEVMFRLAVLALGRRPVTGVGADVAAEIAAVWARIGRVYPAVDLAAGIDVRERRADALAEVAVALACAGLAEPSLQAAAEIDVQQRQEDALARIAVVLASDGPAGSAMLAAAGIHDAERLAETLSGMAVALCRAGRAGEASDMAGQARRAAVDMRNMQRQADALREMAVALSCPAFSGQGICG